MLSRFSNTSIHPSYTSSFELHFALHTCLLSPSMYTNDSSLVEESLAIITSLTSLSRLSISWLTIDFHDFRLSSFSSTSYTGKMEISRSNIVCYGSTGNEIGRSFTFSTNVGILKASANSLRTSYLWWNNSALFSTKNVLQIPCLVSSTAIDASFGFRGSERSERSLEIIETMQTLLPRYLTFDAVYNTHSYNGFSVSCTLGNMTTHTWTAVWGSYSGSPPRSLRFSSTQTKRLRQKSARYMVPFDKRAAYLSSKWSLPFE